MNSASEEGTVFTILFAEQRVTDQRVRGAMKRKHCDWPSPKRLRPGYHVLYKFFFCGGVFFSVLRKFGFGFSPVMYSDLFDDCGPGVCEDFSFLEPLSELFYKDLIFFMIFVGDFYVRPDPDPPLK
jgi:hypothetical protein